MGRDKGTWDAEGFPTGPMPRGEYVLDWQYEANRRTEQRRNALWGDAHQALAQGTELFQSYRPGGSAALASGQYSNQASLYGSQAMSQESPVSGAADPSSEAHSTAARAARLPESTLAPTIMWSLLMPDRRAASAFPPVANMRRPNTVLRYR